MRRRGRNTSGRAAGSVRVRVVDRTLVRNFLSPPDEPTTPRVSMISRAGTSRGAVQSQTRIPHRHHENGTPHTTQRTKHTMSASRYSVLPAPTWKSSATSMCNLSKSASSVGRSGSGDVPLLRPPSRQTCSRNPVRAVEQHTGFCLFFFKKPREATR